jgi:hypothetical protein
MLPISPAPVLTHARLSSRSWNNVFDYPFVRQFKRNIFSRPQWLRSSPDNLHAERRGYFKRASLLP